MESKIELRGYSSSVMVNSTFRVCHINFEVDVNMMMIFCQGKQRKWEVDVDDFCGFSNFILDGKSLSDKECDEYFDFLDKVGIKYRDEVIDMVEKVVESMTDEQIDEFVTHKMGSEKLPTLEVTFEDVEKVCRTIDVTLSNGEKVDIIDKTNHFISTHPDSVNSKSLVIENFIYQSLSKMERL